MILREIKLVSVIVSLCVLATLGITASYANLAGMIGRVTPLFIVIALILAAILLLEALAQKVEIRASMFVASAAHENVIGTLAPVAAAAAMGAILLSLAPSNGSTFAPENAASELNVIQNQ
jgi:hypothetical protein